MATDYEYDDASQLVEEARTGYVASYTYDDNGNRLTKTLNSVTENYAYDAGDKLTAITNGSDPRTFTYDNAGRTTAITRGSNVTAFSYDEEGRTTQITRGGMTTNTYAYNGLDTRVSKVDSLGTRTFKRDGSGVTDSVLNDGSNAYTAGISQRSGSTSKFQLDDYLGTTGRLLDSNENVTDTFSYDAFGIQTARTGTTERPFGFVGSHGYQEDGDTGFKLLGHRYYDPSTGRFLTRDPIKDGRNWYVYCENSPLKWIDPDGLQPTFTGGEVENRLGSDWVVIANGYNESVAGGGTNEDPIWFGVPSGRRSSHTWDIEWVVVINRRTGEIHIFRIYDQARLVLSEDKEGRLQISYADSYFGSTNIRRWKGYPAKGYAEVPRKGKPPKHNKTGQAVLDDVPVSLRPPGIKWPR